MQGDTEISFWIIYEDFTQNLLHKVAGMANISRLSSFPYSLQHCSQKAEEPINFSRVFLLNANHYQPTPTPSAFPSRYLEGISAWETRI